MAVHVSQVPDDHPRFSNSSEIFQTPSSFHRLPHRTSPAPRTRANPRPPSSPTPVPPEPSPRPPGVSSLAEHHNTCLQPLFLPPEVSSTHHPSHSNPLREQSSLYSHSHGSVDFPRDWSCRWNLRRLVRGPCCILRNSLVVRLLKRNHSSYLTISECSHMRLKL